MKNQNKDNSHSVFQEGKKEPKSDRHRRKQSSVEKGSEIPRSHPGPKINIQKPRIRSLQKSQTDKSHFISAD